MVAMLVLGDFEALDLAVARAGSDDRYLSLEIDKALKDTGRIVDRPPRRDRIATFDNPGLALAVVAELSRLEHGRQPYCRRRLGQLHRAVDRRERRGCDLQSA